MTTATAKAEIAARAGVKGGEVTIYFATSDQRPPTLQRIDQWGNPLASRGPVPGRCGVGGRRVVDRRVIVGKKWLQKNAPQLWAAFVAARLTDGFGIPPQLKKDK